MNNDRLKKIYQNKDMYPTVTDLEFSLKGAEVLYTKIDQSTLPTGLPEHFINDVIQIYNVVEEEIIRRKENGEP